MFSKELYWERAWLTFSKLSVILGDVWLTGSDLVKLATWKILSLPVSARKVSSLNLRDLLFSIVYLRCTCKDSFDSSSPMSLKGSLSAAAIWSKISYSSEPFSDTRSGDYPSWRPKVKLVSRDVLELLLA